MAIPQKPPHLQRIFDKYGTEKIVPMITAHASPVYRGQYVHWDKLRHLPLPEGVNAEQMWAALKLARNAGMRPLPLRDVAHHAFKIASPDPIPEILHQIDQGAGGSIEMHENIPTPELRDRYIISSLMEEAIRSSQLEGAATTRKVAKEMIQTGRKPRDRGEQMILNNFVAMRSIQQIKKEPLTPEIIFNLHRLVTDKTLDDQSAAGRLRRQDENIRVEDQYGEVLHVPPAASELPERIARLCDFANKKIPESFVHPVLRAIALHFGLAYDHPFVDGNGRCARALFYWAMLRQGYWLCEYISISEIIHKAPARYRDAFLHTETDENDLTYFALYHLKVIQRAIEELHHYIARKTSETRAATARLRGMAGLNHRQRELLTHALRHPDYTYSVQGHRRSHGIGYDTARLDLLDLARLQLLVLHKSGKKSLFTVSPNLVPILEQAEVT